MGGRMSSRDRIARLREEAEIAQRERDEAKQRREAERATAAPTRRRPPAASQSSGRTKVVWTLCDSAGRSLHRYAYRDEAVARAEAERLSDETGKTHFVKKEDIPFDVEPGPV